MSVNRHDLAGPTRRSLLSGELIDWHDHAVNQLRYPLRGVLEISTPLGVWVVPPHRAAWIPAGVPHAHRAHGPTEMRTLVFAESVNPLRLDRPTVLAADPLLREVIVALCESQDADGATTASARALDARQRRHLELVALDRLRRVEELPFSLPAPEDDRLRAVAAILAADPADERSLAELGRVVGAAERSFVSAIDDGGKTTVQFGDGTHGARPPTGIENIVATYRNGIGTPGNVRARQVSLLATRPLGVKDVINPLRASGGADAETRDQARRNVPLAVLALDRLVSVPDYADFARTFGGVGKAAAIKLGNLVQVTIAGAADAPIDPSSDLYRNLLQALRQYGDPSLPVRLGVRELLALAVSAKVGLLPDFAWESVEPAVRAALLDAFGFERRALAQAVYLSELVACMQAVRGVAWVDVDAFGSLDEATLLAGFGVGGDKQDDGVALMSHAAAADVATVPPRVPVRPARYDGGALRPAQLAYLAPNVPDTLLLQEATP